MIRKPKIEEIELIAQYNRDAAIEAGNNPLDYNKSLGGVKYVIKNPESGFFLVFEKYDKIISMVLVTYEWSDWRSANWYLIQSVYTIPEYRQQGYFKSLLNEIKLISKNDINSCGLKLEVRNDNNRAQNVYKTLGFSDSEHKVFILEK